MNKPRVSPTLLLILLVVATSITSLSMAMLGPLLVALANEFDTSVAVVGQLAGASAITWGITAFLIGPISDTYGRRLVLLTGVMLMGVGILGSVVAWNYGSLLGFRLLTGAAAAMIPATSSAPGKTNFELSVPGVFMYETITTSSGSNRAIISTA